MDFQGTPILRHTQVDGETFSFDLLTGPTGNQSLANTRILSLAKSALCFEECCKDRSKRHDMEWKIDGLLSMIVHDGYFL